MQRSSLFIGVFRWRPQGVWVRVCDWSEFARVELLAART